MFIKFIVAVASGAIYGAIQLFKLLIYGVVAIIGTFQDNRRQRPIPAQASPETAINSPEHKIINYQNQLETELKLADECRKKAAAEMDSYKRIQWRKREQQAEARADALLDKIYKLQGH